MVYFDTSYSANLSEYNPLQYLKRVLKSSAYSCSRNSKTKNIVTYIITYEQIAKIDLIDSVYGYLVTFVRGFGAYSRGGLNM